MAVVLEASIDGMTPISFGNDKAAIQAVLFEQFPNLSYTDNSNWDDFAVVADASGDYLRTRSEIGSNSKKAFTVILPEANTYYARYKVMFESTGTSGIASDDGFDWGDSDGLGRYVWTGGKLPGMMKGSPGDNTGGILDPSVWSGRNNYGGGRTDNTSNQRNFVTMKFYYYGQEANGETNLGTANSYWWPQGHNEEPARFTGGSWADEPGNYGDSRAFKIQTDVWIDILLGYHVPDSNQGWFKSWSMIEGQDTTWQEQLHLPNMRYMGPGNEGIDGFLFQNFWGGSVNEPWQPDRVGYHRYKDFGIFTTEAEAMSHFGALDGTGAVFETTAPADAAVGVTTPVAVSGTADDTAQGYQILVEDVTGATTLEDYGDVAVTHTGVGETWSADVDVVVPQGGQTIRVTPRRWS